MSIGAFGMNEYVPPPMGLRTLLPRFEDANERQRYLDQLNRKITQTPRDLHAHTQRIFMLYLQRDNPAYFGAVIDLLIALGPKGLGLKKSILAPTYGLLNRQQQGYIQQHLHSGIARTAAVPSRYARLSPKLSSDTGAYNHDKSRRVEGDQVLRKARYKLAMEHVDDAQALLEQALISDPSDMEIACELLELYRQYEKMDAFNSMTEQLAGSLLTAQDQWDDTARYFSHHGQETDPTDIEKAQSPKDIS